MAFGSVQTTYSINVPIAYPGLLADINDAQKVTGVNADTVTLPAGIMAAFISSPASDQVHAVSAALGSAGGKIAGVIIHTHAADTIGLQTQTTDLIFKVGATMSLLTKGRIYVLSELDVVQGDPVYYRTVASGGNTQLGGFTNADDGSNTELLKGARFETTATAGTPVVLSFDINAALS